MSGASAPVAVEDGGQTLSDLEFSMVVSINGFWRWVVHCAEAAGARGFSPLDVLVLHMVNHRARNKKLSDICLVMNVEDSHTVAYALKKLEDYGYVAHKQVGRDRVYYSAPEGDAFCTRYREVRQRSLVSSLEADDIDFDRMAELAGTLSRMARYYSHASRTALITAEREV